MFSIWFLDLCLASSGLSFQFSSLLYEIEVHHFLNIFHLRCILSQFVSSMVSTHCESGKKRSSVSGCIRLEAPSGPYSKSNKPCFTECFRPRQKVQLSCIMNGVGTPGIVSVESRVWLVVICDAVFWFAGLLWGFGGSFQLLCLCWEVSLLSRFIPWLHFLLPVF